MSANPAQIPAPEAEPKRPAPASGLIALCAVATVHQVSADPAQVEHALGFTGRQVSPGEVILAAKELGLRAKHAQVTLEGLDRLTLPVVLCLRGGEYGLLLRVEKERVLIRDFREQGARIVDRQTFDQLTDGHAILIKNRLRLDNPNRPFDIFWFVPALLKYRNILGEVLAASLIIQLFALVTPLFTQVIIDKVLSHKSLSTLDVLATGLLIFIVFEGVLNILQKHLMAHTSNRLDVTLGARVVRHMLRLPLRYFEVRRVGDTIARVRELENIRQFLTGSAVTTAIDVLFVGLFLVVMAFYSLVLTGVVLITVVLFVALSMSIRPIMKERLDEKFDRGAESQSFLVEVVGGMQTVKAMALEPVMYRRWETSLARYVTAAFRTSHLSGVAGALGQVIQRGSVLAILWVGATQVMNGEMTVGQLIAFQMLSGRVIDPVLRLVQLYQSFQQVGISIERLGDIMNAKPEPVLNAGRVSLPPIKGSVAMESVRFRYNADGPEVLRNFSLRVAPGTTVGIVGRSGSGKSTLTKLLQRLYVPESGRILIDGVDLQQADPMWLRRQIGVVLQENFLFSGTIRENICIHQPQATMNQISEVARLAGAHDFIMELPEAYDTPVGERGNALSGGQRQRIAIARALLPNPRILIFDEATSALDYESERIIQNNLSGICQGRTVFIIAHRLSTIQGAGVIVVLDKGEVVEVGNHGELLARRGLYHHLFAQQSAGGAS